MLFQAVSLSCCIMWSALPLMLVFACLFCLCILHGSDSASHIHYMSSHMPSSVWVGGSFHSICIRQSGILLMLSFLVVCTFHLHF